MKKALLLIVVIAAVIAVVLWQDGADGPAGAEDKPRVAVTTFALFDAARFIGGETVLVESLLPVGADLHSFEPTPRTMAHLEEAALLVYGGAGLEPWAAPLTGKQELLEMSKHMHLHGESCKDGEHLHEASTGTDPHYWLDIQNMHHAAEAIAEALGRIDPPHAADYLERARIYGRQLDLLAETYAHRLASCDKRMIVVNHNAFGYLAKRYDFEVHAISGLSGDAMPSAKTMAALSDLIKREGVTTVFFESFASDSLTRTLAKETGVAVDVLHPLANVTADQAENKMGYVALMRENLEKIARAMECR